jgi:hypothetical protein
MDEGEIIMGWAWSDYLLPVFALVCSTSSIWLCVRFINRRERGALWGIAALSIVVLIVYPLSLGPASRLSHDPDCPDWLNHELPTFYGPVLRVIDNMPDSLSDIAVEYISLWRQRG